MSKKKTPQIKETKPHYEGRLNFEKIKSLLPENEELSSDIITNNKKTLTSNPLPTQTPSPTLEDQMERHRFFASTAKGSSSSVSDTIKEQHPSLEEGSNRTRFTDQITYSENKTNFILELARAETLSPGESISRTFSQLPQTNEESGHLFLIETVQLGTSALFLKALPDGTLKTLQIKKEGILEISQSKIQQPKDPQHPLLKVNKSSNDPDPIEAYLGSNETLFIRMPNYTGLNIKQEDLVTYLGVEFFNTKEKNWLKRTLKIFQKSE